MMRYPPSVSRTFDDFPPHPPPSVWKPYITVPEGMYALVQTFGADVNHPVTGEAVWPSGML